MNSNNLTLNNLPPSKSAIADHAARLVAQVLDDGTQSPLDLLLQTSIIAEAAAQIRNNADLRDACIDEYNRFGSQEPLRYHGARFTLRETGTTYDYTLCGDPVLLRLLQEKETLDAKIKEREKFLRNLPREGIEATDETTGEITRIYPPARSSTTNIAITLPR